jgi:hypothetical protein
MDWKRHDQSTARRGKQGRGGDHSAKRTENVDYPELGAV